MYNCNSYFWNSTSTLIDLSPRVIWSRNDPFMVHGGSSHVNINHLAKLYEDTTAHAFVKNVEVITVASQKVIMEKPLVDATIGLDEFYKQSTVTMKKRFTCEHCDFKCANNAQLTSHVRKHTGERPYECDKCKKRFARKEEKTRHLRIHTGQRPYKCKVCGKSFGRKDHLNKHMQIHDPTPMVVPNTTLDEYWQKVYSNLQLFNQLQSMINNQTN